MSRISIAHLIDSRAVLVLSSAAQLRIVPVFTDTYLDSGSILFGCSHAEGLHWEIHFAM